VVEELDTQQARGSDQILRLSVLLIPYRIKIA
jgi:hypothetical protein